MKNFARKCIRKFARSNVDVGTRDFLALQAIARGDPTDFMMFQIQDRIHTTYHIYRPKDGSYDIWFGWGGWLLRPETFYTLAQQIKEGTLKGSVPDLVAIRCKKVALEKVFLTPINGSPREAKVFSSFRMDPLDRNYTTKLVQKKPQQLYDKIQHLRQKNGGLTAKSKARWSRKMRRAHAFLF